MRVLFTLSTKSQSTSSKMMFSRSLKTIQAWTPLSLTISIASYSDQTLWSIFKKLISRMRYIKPELKTFYSDMLAHAIDVRQLLWTTRKEITTQSWSHIKHFSKRDIWKVWEQCLEHIYNQTYNLSQSRELKFHKPSKWVRMKHLKLSEWNAQYPWILLRNTRS